MRAALPLLLLGCGRLGFDPFGSEPPPPDAAPAAPRCDPALPFGAPELLSHLSSPQAEIGVELVDDRLGGFFWSNRLGPDRIYETTRERPGDALGAPVLRTELAAPGGESDRDPCPSGDGLSVVFASLRSGGGGGDWDLWMSERASRNSLFAAPQPLTSVNAGGSDWGPYLTSSGLALYYIDGADLAVVRRGSLDKPFGSRQTLTSLNTISGEYEPTVTPDELSIFFASGRPGQGGLDIWYSQRRTTAELFPEPQGLTELNTAGDDIPSWISPDLCELHFTRSNGGNGWDLYVARRPL